MTACYDRRDNQVTGYFPCSPDGSTDLAQCCSPGDSCASNGLCVASSLDDSITPYFADGCTVAGWVSNATVRPATCLAECAGVGTGVQVCGEGTFCCYGYGGCDCDDASAVFTLAPVSIVTSIAADIASRTTTSSTSTRTTTPTMATTASSSSSSSSGTTTGSASGPSAAAAQTTPPTTTGTPAATATASSGGSGGSSGLGVGLGVGLGAGLALALAAAAGAWWWLRRRRRRRGGNNGGGGGGGVAGEAGKPETPWDYDRARIVPGHHELDHHAPGERERAPPAAELHAPAPGAVRYPGVQELPARPPELP